MSTTLLKAWTAAKDQLAKGQIDQPAIDARLLLEAASGATRTDIITDPYRVFTDEQQATLDGFVERRLRREPVSRILGRKGFWKIMLNLTPDVLTPRPDTESILDVALPLLPEGEPLSILDLGVGSGAILLALLSERPAARGLGIDVSSEALAVARENAANLDLAGRCTFLRGDWTHGLETGGFDLVVSNPPYIPTKDIETLDPEVRDHDPRLALDGGEDGLDAYRLLAPEILRVLKPGAPFVVEIGHDQAQSVSGLFNQAGAIAVRVAKDLANRDRVVTGVKNPLEIAG